MTPTGSDQEDRDAMVRLNAGEDAALDELMDRHREKLFHYLLRFLQNETEASDLAEDAFVRVYQNRGRFNPKHKFSTWLYTIATNLGRDVQRFRARHPQVSLEYQRDEEGPGRHETIPESRPDPGEVLESAERADAVRQAIAALPEDLRAPLLLTTYEEQSYAEVAEILNCSVKAVEMRLYRARQELRQKLEKVLATL